MIAKDPTIRYRFVAAVLPFVLYASVAFAQDVRFEFPGVSTGVRDTAKVFSEEAVRNTKAEIDRIERESKASILIETVDSVGKDSSVKAAAASNARRWGREGVYVLIDKNDHRFEVLPTPGMEKAVSREDVQVFRDAFLTQFKRGKFDDGLLNGVQAIGLTFSVAAKEGKIDRREEQKGGDDLFNKLAQGTHGSAQLVERNQVKLTLTGARVIVSAAQAKATELKLKVNVAVVDEGGHLLSFDRMDGGRPASVYTAITKATSAATFRSETRPAAKVHAEPDVAHELSLQNAAAVSGGKITTLHGGIPVIVDGQVIGGVGVGGGTGEQDSVVAKAGIDRLLSSLRPEAEGK